MFFKIIEDTEQPVKYIIIDTEYSEIKPYLLSKPLTNIESAIKAYNKIIENCPESKKFVKIIECKTSIREVDIKEIGE